MTNSTHHRFLILLQGYVKQSLADAELTEFFELLRKPENRVLLGESFEQDLRQGHINGLSSEAQIKEAFEKLFAKLPQKPAVVKRMYLIRIAVAASVLLVIGLASYFFFFNKPDREDDIVKINLSNDVEAPKGTRAMITLADGRRVSLDSLASGTLVMQGNVNVVKTVDGQIIYKGSSAEVEYNTLFNPRGSKVVPLILSDGTRVWLNSESSIRYPMAFAGNERNVEITGEAYFEVAKDATKKFILTASGVTTEVMGTHFNINTYTDESSIKVTLLEGSVRVNKSSLIVFLKPGQQAQVGSDVKVVSGINVDEVTAWKNGRFAYSNTDLETIMKQLARWYDVEVVYKDKITDRYTVTTPRDVPVSQLFKFIEMSGGVHFKIEGRKITVMK